MATKLPIPGRSAGDTTVSHISDHTALHRDYDKSIPATRTVSYTLVPGTDGLVFFNGASLVATLPTAAGALGEWFTVKNLNASVLTLTSAAGTIDGAANRLLNQYDSASVVSDDTNWNVI